MNANQAWQRVVGDANVVTRGPELDAAQETTFATTQRIACIVRPGTRDEVADCVRIANQYRAPVYPISGGQNWGLGSMVPVTDGCALLDLRRLNRIVDFNEKLAYITVEPGVTFRQAHRFLSERGSELLATVTGGPPDGSLIGNAVDRGDGPGPYGDRAGHACSLEVILPTGETVRTGFGRMEGARTAATNRWGVGPFLDGLFLQSNLGIVTEMTVWLFPRPRCFQRFMIRVADTAELAEVIDAVQPLVLDGTLTSNALGFWNAYKVLAERGRFPWKATRGATPLSLRALKGREPWYGAGALYSASAERQIADRKQLETALVDHPSPPIFSSPEPYTDDPYLGVPTERNLRSTYWRKRHGPSSLTGELTPERDRCGVIWLCPTFPFDGAQIRGAIELIHQLITAHGFEPNVGMSCATGRAINAFVAIMFDRDLSGEDDRALACHDDVFDKLLEAGFPPYRLGIQSMASLPASDTPYENLLRTLKTALDPNDILAPGRYDFRRRWSGLAAAPTPASASSTR